jgi:hypothetical protein
VKKVCILSAVNIRHMSLISIYTDIFKEYGVDFDIIYWINMEKKKSSQPRRNM